MEHTVITKTPLPDVKIDDVIFSSSAHRMRITNIAPERYGVLFVGRDLLHGRPMTRFVNEELSVGVITSC